MSYYLKGTEQEYAFQYKELYTLGHHLFTNESIPYVQTQSYYLDIVRDIFQYKMDGWHHYQDELIKLKLLSPDSSPTITLSSGIAG